MKAGVARATLLALATVLAACGTTTVESGPSTTYVGETTTAPVGTPDELLDRLVATSFTLGNAIIDGEPHEVMDELDALWLAASTQLPRTDFALGVEHQLALMHTAVDRHRAADADKAARHIEELVKARQP